MKYQYDFWIEFNGMKPTPDIDGADWNWMKSISREIDGILKNEQIGFSDGFGGGFKQLDVYGFIYTDPKKAGNVIRKYLEQVELLGYCNYILIRELNDNPDLIKRDYIYQRA